jgi:hypothetical protein
MVYDRAHEAEEREERVGMVVAARWGRDDLHVTGNGSACESMALSSARLVVVCVLTARNHVVKLTPSHESYTRHTPDCVIAFLSSSGCASHSSTQNSWRASAASWLPLVDRFFARLRRANIALRALYSSSVPLCCRAFL